MEVLNDGETAFKNNTSGWPFFISAGGLFMHLFVHEPQEHAYGLVPLIAGTFSIVLIPWLFCFKKTLHLAYLLNGFMVINFKPPVQSFLC
jgi:hypothetical protein